VPEEAEVDLMVLDAVGVATGDGADADGAVGASRSRASNALAPEGVRLTVVAADAGADAGVDAAGADVGAEPTNCGALVSVTADDEGAGADVDTDVDAAGFDSVTAVAGTPRFRSKVTTGVELLVVPTTAAFVLTGWIAVDGATP
jgi:hypothetical protein